MKIQFGLLLSLVFLIVGLPLVASSKLVIVGTKGTHQDRVIRKAEKHFWACYNSGDYTGIPATIQELEHGLDHAQGLIKNAVNPDHKARATAYKALMQARLGWLYLWRVSELAFQPPQTAKLAPQDSNTASQMFIASYQALSAIPHYATPAANSLLEGFVKWQPSLLMAVDGFRGGATYGLGRSTVAQGAKLVAQGQVPAGINLLQLGSRQLTSADFWLFESTVRYPAFNGYTHAAVTQTDVGELKKNLTALLGILSGCEDCGKFDAQFAAYKAYFQQLPKQLQTPATTVPPSQSSICINTNRVPHNFETQFMTLGDLLFMAQGQTYTPSTNGGTEAPIKYQHSMKDVRTAWELADTAAAKKSWVGESFLNHRLSLISPSSGDLESVYYRLSEGTIRGTGEEKGFSLLDLKNSQADRVRLLRSSRFQSPGCFSCHQGTTWIGPKQK